MIYHIMFPILRHLSHSLQIIAPVYITYSVILIEHYQVPYTSTGTYFSCELRVVLGLVICLLFVCYLFCFILHYFALYSSFINIIKSYYILLLIKLIINHLIHDRKYPQLLNCLPKTRQRTLQ